jgi:A/G-specific adenine glycosylase
MSKFLIALKKLDEWFQSQQRVLPWRNLPSVYRVWISEIMLQQTQVKAVIPYFEKFIARFPTVEVLAEADEAEVMQNWAGLGYYARARNLHKGAKKIAELQRFPRTREEWLEIPGIGPYTAGAILSISGDKPEAILDGNVERVLSRVNCVTRQKGDAKFKQELWSVSKDWVETAYQNKIKPSNLNQALMELGATLCSVTLPQCERCPVRKICRAYEQGVQGQYPPKKKPKSWVSMTEELHCVINPQGEVLLRQRLKGEWRAGLWDFLEEIPGRTKSNLHYLTKLETRHVVTHHKITRVTRVWRISKEANLPSGVRWISLKHPNVALGSAAKKIVEDVSRLDFLQST